MKRKKIVNSLTAYIFIAPLVVGIVLFYIYPIFGSFYFSLTDWDGLNPMNFIGFQNYRNMLSDPTILTEFANTIFFTVISVPITIFLSTIIASILNQKIRAGGIFRTIFFLPYITLPVATALVWFTMFNSQFGIVNAMLSVFGMRPMWLMEPMLLRFVIILNLIWSGLGFNSIILLIGIQSIPSTYYEAAEIDGANRIKQFFFITLPLLTPQIFFVFIMGLIGTLRLFDQIFIFGRISIIARESVRTVTYGIFIHGFTNLRMGYAAAVSVVLFLFIMIVTITQFILQKKWVHY